MRWIYTLAIALFLSNFLWAVTIDFETGSHGQVLTTDVYLSQGIRLYGATIFTPPSGGWDLTHSGTRGFYSSSAMSIDATLSNTIATNHGINIAPGTSVADVVFVLPGTTTQATVDQFSIWIGFDPAAGASEGNYIIIEAFDLSNTRVVNFTSVSLVNINMQFQSFSAAGIARLRLTQIGGVGFDDLSFTTPVVPEPNTFVLCGLLILGFAIRRFTR